MSTQALEVHVAAWNPHVSSNPDRVLDYISDTRQWADMWAFNEVRPLYGALDFHADQRGLGHFQERPESYGAVVSEKGSSALLTDTSFKVDTFRVEALIRRWKVFSKDRWHFGRRLIVVRGKKDRRRVKVVVVHGPTNGPSGGNAWAYAEFLATLLRIIVSTAPGTLLIIVGDWNAKGDEIRRWMNSPLLSGLGLRVDGHNVDWCMVRGGTVSAKVAGSKRGSDHYPIQFTVVRLEKKIAKVVKALANRKKNR